MKISFCCLILLIQTFLVFSEDKVKIEILREQKDCQRKAEVGKTIHMHYKGTLASNGKEFDSSYKRDEEFVFQLGSGKVIQGWEQGVPGMCVGEKRKLTIPPSLGYGDRAFGDIIPAGSTLIFEIELMSVNDGKNGDANQEHSHDHSADHGETFETIDTDKNGEITSEEMAAYIKGFEDPDAENEGEESPEDSVETIVSEIFQEDDKNKDGVISLEEFQHAGEASDNSDYEQDLGDEDGSEPKEEL